MGPRIKKLILFRLLFGCLLLYAPQVFRGEDPVPLYASSVLICVLSVLYVLWYLTRRRLRWLAMVQILADVGLETFLVFFTGGAESLFTIFYTLSILSSALVVGEKKFVIWTTFLASFGYMADSLMVYRWRPIDLTPHDPIYLYYGAAMKVAIFIAVGQLSRYLSQTVLELRHQLNLSERLSSLGEVVSKIAHEIRNPLSAIRTAAEVLRDSLPGKLSPQEGRMLAIVDQESDRLTKTLERILSYARQAKPQPKMLLFDPLIERALAVVRLDSRLHSNGIAVEKKYNPSQIHVYADEEQIFGAVLNLTLNAFQAMPEGGVFRITAEESLKGTRIDLEDTAGGIPKDKLKDLFVPFKSSKKGGTGLGLAEVHKIVTLHEGKIEVEAHSGKGTIFHLFFPKP